jgi:hypothetical protein
LSASVPGAAIVAPAAVSADTPAAANAGDYHVVAHYHTAGDDEDPKSGAAAVSACA